MSFFSIQHVSPFFVQERTQNIDEFCNVFILKKNRMSKSRRYRDEGVPFYSRCETIRQGLHNILKLLPKRDLKLKMLKVNIVNVISIYKY